ncbi:MAG: tetratricopeptide repeat protein, partial [Bacteroidetes bacterium]|nr:tetratricopeptide repeat protein [Bacteroidota bacterium]
MTDQDIQSKIDTATELLKEARIYYEHSDYNESERCANEVLALLEPLTGRDDLGDGRDKTSQKHTIIEQLAHVYNRLNTISGSRGENVLALSQAEIALQFSEVSGNLQRKGALLGNIGFVYRNLGDSAKALEYMQKALTLFEELGDKEGIAANLGQYGLVYWDVSDYAKALEYLQKALAIYEELGGNEGIAINLSNMGSVYGKIGEHGKALEYFQRALAINEKIGRIAGIANNLGSMGAIYADRTFDGYDAAKAEEFLLKALAFCDEIGEKPLEYEFLKYLADLYEQEERWKDFAINLKKFYEVEKKVQSEEAKKQA